MPRQGRASGYSLLPSVLVTLFWLLFEELLRRYIPLSPWASIPLGLIACLAFFFLLSQAEDLAGWISRGLKK